MKSPFRLALAGSQVLLGGVQDASNTNAESAVFSSSCPVNPPLSCTSGALAMDNSCCTNYPGGQFALTQFWNSDAEAGVPGYLGPRENWTLHGLWPDHCDGSFDSVCDCDRSGDCSSSNRKCKSHVCNRDYSSVTRILEKFGQGELLAYMTEHWKGIRGDEHIWQHEWSKHGTCCNTLEPKCYGDGYQTTQEVVEYFRIAVALHQTLPTYKWLQEAHIVPSKSKKYTREEIQDALNTPRGVSAVVVCQGKEFREVWYHFKVRGPLQDGEFIPSDPDFSGARGPLKGCPETGIRYLPKEID